MDYYLDSKLSCPLQATVYLKEGFLTAYIYIYICVCVCECGNLRCVGGFLGRAIAFATYKGYDMVDDILDNCNHLLK